MGSLTRSLTRQLSSGLTYPLGQLYPGGAIPTPPVGKLQNVVGFNVLPVSLSGPDENQRGWCDAFPFKVVGGRLTHIVISDSCLVFGQTGYALPVGGHDITYRRIAIACYSATSAVGSDAYAPITYNGGESMTMTAGDIDKRFDTFSIQDEFGIDALDEGDIFWVRFEKYLQAVTGDNSMPTSMRRDSATNQGIGTATNIVFDYDGGVRILGAGVYGTQTMTVGGGSEFFSTFNPAPVPMVLGYFEDGAEPVNIFVFGGQSVWNANAGEGQQWNYGPIAAVTAGVPYGQLAIPQPANPVTFSTGNSLLWLTTFGRYFNTFMIAIGEDSVAANPLSDAAFRIIMETARTTCGMKVIAQSIMPRSSGSWTTDPDANQTIVSAPQVSADGLDAIVDTYQPTNVADYYVQQSLIIHATSGDGARKWTVATVGAITAPHTQVGGPAADPAGRAPNLDVHTDFLAPPIATAFAAVTVGPALDRQTYINCSAVTTAFTPQARSNLAATGFFILIDSTKIAAFDALNNAQQVAHIKAGTDAGDVAATSVQSTAMTAGVSTPFSPITGLPTNTGFKGYWCATDSSSRSSIAHSMAFTTSNGAAAIGASITASSENASSLTTVATVFPGGTAGFEIHVNRATGQTTSEITGAGMSLTGGTIALVHAAFVSSTRVIEIYHTTQAPIVPGSAIFTLTFTGGTGRCSICVNSVKYGTPATLVRAASYAEASGTSSTPTATAVSVLATDLVIGAIAYAQLGLNCVAGTNETQIFNYLGGSTNSFAAEWQAGANGGEIKPTLDIPVAWAAVAVACPGAA